RSVLSHLHAPAAARIYTLSLHDALPISATGSSRGGRVSGDPALFGRGWAGPPAENSPRAVACPTRPRGYRAVRRSRRAAATKGRDRKSTRLNSSHLGISYAVFCLKKKKP